MSSKVKLCLSQHFSTNWRITREPEELQCRGKGAFDSSFDAHSLWCPWILSKINGLPYREQKIIKITVFKTKPVFVKTNFDSVKIRHSYRQHRVPFVEICRMNYNLTLTLALYGGGWMSPPCRFCALYPRF